MQNQTTIKLTRKASQIETKSSCTRTSANTAVDGTSGIRNQRAVYYTFISIGIEGEILYTGALVGIALDWYCVGDCLAVYGVAGWTYCCSAVVVAICL